MKTIVIKNKEYVVDLETMTIWTKRRGKMKRVVPSTPQYKAVICMI